MLRLKISWDEYGRRLSALREVMAERKYDAMLVTNGVSIFYLSGFNHMVTERPAALLVPPDGKPVFMGPLLEADHLRHQTPIVGEAYTYLDYPGETHPIDLFAKWLTELDYSKATIGADNHRICSGFLDTDILTHCPV